MKEIRGPAIFLAQFLRDEPPYDRLDTIADWCKPRLGVAFARAYRAGQFETKGHNATNKQIAGGTVDTALGNVAKAFRDKQRPDPFVDPHGGRAQQRETLRLPPRPHAGVRACGAL